MKRITYYSTNNRAESAGFQEALMRGLASNYGLYMMDRRDIPKLSKETIQSMAGKSYAETACEVLHPYLVSEMPESDAQTLLEDAYDERVIPTKVQHVTGETSIMWLTRGPTYSFKDYAARFFGRTLNYFLGRTGRKRVVLVATSGDTGGAVADALHGLDNVDNVVFYPRTSISERQRRQMTTLGGNVFAVAVNGDFDVCQSLVKRLLGDKALAEELFQDADRFTSANSISLGRLLPQAVYPFYAYSRVATFDAPMIASVPSGNFGDMMGTVIAREMGLPIGKIVCGVNENTEFPDFLETGRYVVRPSVESPSSAMIVSNPSNLARLIDLYGGHIHDERDPDSGKVVCEGVIDRMPDLDAMRRDLYSVGIMNPQHFETIREVYETYGVLLDPHGAVGWRSLDLFLGGRHDRPAVIYETADPGKFPEDILKAVGFLPPVPAGMAAQANLEERIYQVTRDPGRKNGAQVLSDEQYQEAGDLLRSIYSRNV